MEENKEGKDKETALAPKKPWDQSMIYEGANKVDYYGLSDVVLRLRRKGCSYMAISQYLEDNYNDILKDDTINMMTISRYCKKHMKNEETDRKDGNINVYNENVNMLTIVDDNIELLKAYLDSVTKKIKEGIDTDELVQMLKLTQNLQNNLDKYLARKQDIVNHIFSLQTKVYNMQTMNNVIELVLDTVHDYFISKGEPDNYEQMVAKLRENEKFREAVKRIQPNK